MTYAFARIGAVVAMRVDDYYPEGKRWWLRLHEKGGKRHEMPAHHQLEAFIDEYVAAAGIRDDGKSPLVRTVIGRTGRLSDEAPRGGSSGIHYLEGQAMTTNAVYVVKEGGSLNMSSTSPGLTLHDDAEEAP
jgi:hypothetical protein